jgi:hypothetical protein
MKRFALLVCCSAALAFGTDLAAVKNVYLLKMSKGMDQYLANRLTNEHLFLVVTDPKLADGILTDQIGSGFEAKMDELFPPPEPVDKPEKTDKAEKAGDSQSAASMLGDSVNKLANPAASSSFGRAKGTVFLVDAKTKEVVWSTYGPPKDSSSKEMDRTATDIVSRLKRELKKK